MVRPVWYLDDMSVICLLLINLVLTLFYIPRG
jgi:hypothetical protein